MDINVPQKVPLYREDLSEENVLYNIINKIQNNHKDEEEDP